MSEPIRLEEVTIDMNSSPQIMELRLICNVSEFDEYFTLYRFDSGAFVDQADTLSITLTDQPEYDDTKLEQFTTFVITPLFGYMSNMELYETGVDTNMSRSRHLEMVVDMTHFDADNEIDVSLTNSLFFGVDVMETLTKTGDDPFMFEGSGVTMTFELFSGTDPTKPDDIRALVTCSMLNLENAFIDAYEIDDDTMIFRTGELHNQGVPGSELFWKLFHYATRKHYFDVSEETKNIDGYCDAELFLKDSNGAIFPLEEPLPKIKVQGTGGKVEIEYLKDYLMNGDLTVKVLKYDDNVQTLQPRIEYEDEQKTSLIIRIKSLDEKIYMKVDCNILHLVRELVLLGPDIDVDSDNNFSIDDEDDVIENDEDEPGCFVIINDNDSGPPDGDDHENSEIDTEADIIDLEVLKIREINADISELVPDRKFKIFKFKFSIWHIS